MNKAINKYIDHTALKPNLSSYAIDKLCEEAIQYDFFAVCVNGSHVYQAKQLLKNTNIKVASVIGFPLGANSTNAKVFEAKDAVADGADEIDMVLNIGWLISGEYEAVENEIAMVKRNVGDRVLKVIFENCYLSNTQILEAVELCIRAKADYVKTSTGFGPSGATLENVELMVDTADKRIKIKASGGIRNLHDFKKYVELGADRIGTSSGVGIMESM